MLHSPPNRLLMSFNAAGASTTAMTYFIPATKFGSCFWSNFTAPGWRGYLKADCRVSGEMSEAHGTCGRLSRRVESIVLANQNTSVSDISAEQISTCLDATVVIFRSG